jgi:hypothetical protein
MDFEQQTPRKRALRAFRRVKKTKARSLNFTTQHTLTRGDYGPKEKPTTGLPDDIGFFYSEGE